jgi:hypothetical protein
MLLLLVSIWVSIRVGLETEDESQRRGESITGARRVRNVRRRRPSPPELLVEDLPDEPVE